MAILLMVALTGLSCALFSGCSSGAGCSSSPPSPGALYFYVDTCPICKKMKPILDGIEEEYGGDFKVVRINNATAEGKKIAREHGILGQPTLLFFDKTGRETRRLMGFQSSQILEKEIDRLVGRQ